MTGAYRIVANLTGTNLTDANLTRAYLERANPAHASLTWANLTDAILNGAGLSYTVLGHVDLSGAVGLETCYHRGPSFIDYQTLQNSGQLPLQFLRGVGLPDPLIEYHCRCSTPQSVGGTSCF